MNLAFAPKLYIMICVSNDNINQNISNINNSVILAPKFIILS
jgi:hypothetical protein